MYNLSISSQLGFILALRPLSVLCCLSYSDLALFVFLLLSFIMRNTRAYEEMENKAVIPV